MPRNESHDLVIVGAGPAGLSAAVGAESENIDTLVLDSKSRLGGQAGTSSLIENFPGFPDGVTGPELVARMTDQALRFDTEFIAPLRVEGIRTTEESLVLFGDSDEFIGRAALLSCGVDYRRLKARNLAAYLGRGVTYGSPHMGNTYKDRKICVVGGANSAGQAAMHLAQFTGCNVRMLIRGKSIEDKMSGYLVDRVVGKDNIEVLTESEVQAVNGNGRLEKVTIKTGEDESVLEIDELFVFIGAVPRTKWLPQDVVRDKLGFVVAGNDLPIEVRERFEGVCGRPPFSHETSKPGLFVAGDVKSGSIKRVASAVGDSMGVIPELHQYFALRQPLSTTS